MIMFSTRLSVLVQELNIRALMNFIWKEQITQMKVFLRPDLGVIGTEDLSEHMT